MTGVRKRVCRGDVEFIDIQELLGAYRLSENVYILGLRNPYNLPVAPNGNICTYPEQTPICSECGPAPLFAGWLQIMWAQLQILWAGDTG